MKALKRPKVIDVEQWRENDSFHDPSHPGCVLKDGVCHCTVSFAEPGGGGSPMAGPHIHTSQGGVLLSDGDWVAMQTIDGKPDFWPIADKTFKATYDLLPVVVATPTLEEMEAGK